MVSSLEAIVDAIKTYAASRGISREHFESQMLFGVRRDLQRHLVRDGYKVRIYVPFGTEWYPCFMCRLAERPANVLFLAGNFFRCRVPASLNSFRAILLARQFALA